MGTSPLGIRLLSILAAVAFIGVASAQDAEKKVIPPQAELEKQFKETLSDCVFDGHWCMVNEGKLTEEKSEKYNISSATKSGQDVWIIYAKMQFQGKDVNVPVPVQVKWAGDTAVITLDKVTIPGLGTYSARVLVFEGTYSGTWSAGDHGGMLHGIIRKKDKKAE
ncbi:MAG TPA: hypothetical protein VM735_06375 [Candidatus Kapabacteria bacterium]|nr:hypothetical protein [Candidatus Kapabacteria bacterium]